MSYQPARPSRFRIPRANSPDRQRARKATVRHFRTQYELAVWDPPSEPMWAGSGEWLEFPLPLKISSLPPAEKFAARKWGLFISNQAQTQLNQAIAFLFHPLSNMDSYREYATLFETIRPPEHAAEYWRSDLDFGRQRLNGCNPMTLKRCDDLPTDALCRAADETLSTLAPEFNVQRAYDQGRLFMCDYSAMSLVDDLIDPEIATSAPTAVFIATEDGHLRPLAIRLHGEDYAGPNQPVTPHTGPNAWALAKAHFQMADGAYHEAVSHLLETHLVIELIAVSTHRNLHPDHPVSQLLLPHFVDNLAIDALARTSLLNKNGPIDKAIGAGARGALNLVGAIWRDWDFAQKGIEQDLALRGLDDKNILTHFWYRDDGLQMIELLRQMTTHLVRVWYRDEDELRGDWEIQAWAAAIASEDGADLRGFPVKITTRRGLARLLAEIIFRASAQHAAVNNGQYDRYGWPLYSPTALAVTPANVDIASGKEISERDFWQTMPNRRQSLAQLSMARVLSAPTYASLIRTGEAGAFSQEVSPAASQAVRTYRRRLAATSDSFRRRNAGLVAKGAAPYVYMDPYNVARSIEI